MDPNQLAMLQQMQQPSPEEIQAQRDQVLRLKMPVLSRMHNFRRQYDQRRLGFYRQYSSQRDQTLFPDNTTKRSNSFVPYSYSNVETVVSRVLDAFFGGAEDWFECKGRGYMDEPAAEKMQLVLSQKLKRAKFQVPFEDLVKNISIYGHAGIKVDWDWDYDVVTKPQAVPAMDPSTGQPVIDPSTGQPIILGIQKITVKVPHSRPRITAIDIFDLLVDPDGSIVAHMVERTFGQMKREAEVNPELYYPEALQEIAVKLGQEEEPDAVIIRFAELWDNSDNTCTLIVYGMDADGTKMKDQRYAIDSGATASTYKRKMYGGQPVLLWHGPNPFAHQRNPILHTSFTKRPNTVYGVGVIEPISELNESLNKFANMITDNWNMGINRRYAYDSNADIDHKALNSLNVPGGKVAVNGDPSKVLFPLPSFTPNAGDYAIMDLYKGMIEMTSGISDFYSKGIGSGVGNRTATGINQVISESNYRFKMFIRNLEIEVLQPLLEMCASMVQQFVSDQEEVMITDEAPGIPKYIWVKPEELLGALDFNLVAANYAQNKVVRQRNLLAFASTMGGSPWLNQGQLIRELAKVHELRGIAQLVKTDEQVAAEQAAEERKNISMMLLESYLNMETKVYQAEARQSGKVGRPPKMQFEGKIPGVGNISNLVREVAQGLNSANSLGLESMGGGSDNSAV